MRFLAMAAVCALALAGCATDIMSEEECIAGDWYAAGIEDGRIGQPLSAFEERAGLCSQYGVAPDGPAYMQGRDTALRQLCTYSGGSGLGAAGRKYYGVCAAAAEEEFLAGYLSSARINAARQDRDAAEAAYDSAVGSADYHRDEIRRARRILNDPKSTEKQIARARRSLDYSRDALPRAENDIDRALYELGRADADYEAIVGTIQDWLRGDDFFYARASLMDAYEFARAVDAVDYCTDEGDFFPVCRIRTGDLIADDATGATCVIGPGLARMTRSDARLSDGRRSGVVQRYEYFPINPRGGNAASRPEGAFNVYFDETGAVDGLACAGYAP